ncbi:selenocysteine-specific translation elongation factor [Desulfonema magnum]|uniref:Selenocysteine-specific elongation factor n=1 Tax=Desulfonema magnum TaxID=45655 RepID=A0A975BIN0_9BACT|nr:selenocysteine-specific translation elongation factor [Desulfonema magnum]QTA86043.1 Selenocysteine-specific elongation factor [Desulfonema magnum]
MKQIILGTAGHIDHGKTSLIKAVTGTNTDRLKEEQQRGITIELGFASLDLPGGQHLGIVDVPGHEKFVKNMVAGASGIDLVAMVIAADEGVMPQTREHMEICNLLGVKHGLVVLTKTDLVDEEWLELVQEDISSFVEGTFLEDKPVVPVSSATGEGISEFVNILDDMSAMIPTRSSTGLFRLPVDRVFTMKGFGTVITGTLISGRVRVGDTIMIYPSCITSKVRGLQVHNQSVNEAEAGMRTAINFQGLEKTAVTRGEVLSNPDALIPSYMLDMSLHFLPSNKKAIKNRTRVRFHAGTSEVLGNLILIDREELEPGETLVAQLRLDTPVAVVKDDKFVIRSYSPVRTIGGGHIINPIPPKHKRFRPEVIEGLQQLVDSPPEEIIAYHIDHSGYKGVSFSELKIMTNLPEKQLDKTLQELLSKRTVIRTDKEKQICIHHNSFEKLKKEIHNYLDGYHKTNPLKVGMSKEELKSKFPAVVGPKLLNLMLNQMIKDKEIVPEEDIIRLSTHEVSLGVDQADVKEKILEAYVKGGLTPPYFKELGKTLSLDAVRAKDVLMILVGEGKIIKAKEDLYFHTDAINELKTKVTDFFLAHEEMTTPDFKTIASVSRKYLIPLLEYFDSKNITIRVGDVRKLRSR